MELYLKTREEWHEWLEDNHAVIPGIWLVYYKKISGKTRIAYNDVVEEALCFGWIDGKIKRVNDDYYIQWFTPRRPGSRWSKLNMGKVEKLIREGKMKPEGLKVYEDGVKRPQIKVKSHKVLKIRYWSLWEITFGELVPLKRVSVTHSSAYRQTTY